MEMDPNSAAFQRIFSNVFAYTAFKSTEPWLVDYVTLDLHDAMTQVGQSRVACVTLNNTSAACFSLISHRLGSRHTSLHHEHRSHSIRSTVCGAQSHMM
jgi:hypothetical protein